MDEAHVSARLSTAIELDVERFDSGRPPEAPVVAVKRLPPFTDADRLNAYAGRLELYVEILRGRGVSVAARGPWLAASRASPALPPPLPPRYRYGPPGRAQEHTR